MGDCSTHLLLCVFFYRQMIGNHKMLQASIRQPVLKLSVSAAMFTAKNRHQRMFAVEDTRAKLICNRMLLLGKKKIVVSRVCSGVGESEGLDLVSEKFLETIEKINK